MIVVGSENAAYSVEHWEGGVCFFVFFFSVEKTPKQQQKKPPAQSQ